MENIFLYKKKVNYAFVCLNVWMFEQNATGSMLLAADWDDLWIDSEYSDIQSHRKQISESYKSNYIQW